MFGYRLQELGCDGQNDLTARGKVTIWGGKRQIHRADDERKRVGARLGERGVRGRPCRHGRHVVDIAQFNSEAKASPFLTG